MNSYEKLLDLLPQSLRQDVMKFTSKSVEELRIRLGKPVSILCEGVEHEINCIPVDRHTIQLVVQRATDASMHSAANAMSEGYISYKGLRIGLCGIVSMHEGCFAGFRSISSLAIRIPRECRGVCNGIINELYRESFSSTLIISPPGGGKTTALRELIRCISEKGTRIAVVDERNEIAGDFDVGKCTDVLSGITKSEGAIMLLRGMNPEIIAMDEISREKDVDTIMQIHGCGVKLLATAHAADIQDLTRRNVYKALIDAHVFSNIVCICGTGSMRRYRSQKL